ncbi:MAG: NAD(P)-dependent oxidoreductase [Lentisphaeraceae bacterium]|nr:NAD(P)-dependent oxidoreductase [Lentisphaeraceae bacterium]
MIKHLHNEEMELVVFNRSKPVLKTLPTTGVSIVESPQEVAELVKDGPIILMLSNIDAVKDVTEGANGLFQGLSKGACVIDMGSSAVEGTKEMAQKAAALDANWLDAPVSGGEEGAQKANLTIMVGGQKEIAKQAFPVLNLLGSSVNYMGPSGAGQATKLANQILVATTIASVSEAFLLCEKNGVDLSAARKALLGGFASSKILDMHGLRMIQKDFVPGGTVINQLKDVLEALKLAKVNQLNLPMLETNIKLWTHMTDAGLGELDHSGLYEWYQQSNNKVD